MRLNRLNRLQPCLIQFSSSTSTVEFNKSYMLLTFKKLTIIISHDMFVSYTCEKIFSIMHILTQCNPEKNYILLPGGFVLSNQDDLK